MSRRRASFTGPQRLLHWLMAACILAMLFIGVGMISTVTPKYLTLVSIHKPLGIVVLVLALIRLALRARYGAPPLPTGMPEPMKLAAHLSHYAFYALMIVMPLLGWGMLSAAAYPVVLIGSLRLPAILPHSDRLHTWLWDAHHYLAFAFFALILLHVAAALFHALIRRDGVFETMVPRPMPDDAAPGLEEHSGTHRCRGQPAGAGHAPLGHGRDGQGLRALHGEGGDERPGR